MTASEIASASHAAGVPPVPTEALHSEVGAGSNAPAYLTYLPLNALNPHTCADEDLRALTEANDCPMDVRAYISGLRAGRQSVQVQIQPDKSALGQAVAAITVARVAIGKASFEASRKQRALKERLMARNVPPLQNPLDDILILDQVTHALDRAIHEFARANHSLTDALARYEHLR